MQVTTVGLDLAKHWFQIHGIDANGRVIVRRRLWRSGVIAFFRSLEPCLVGMEACATAHYWARELMALGQSAGFGQSGKPYSNSSVDRWGQRKTSEPQRNYV